MAVLDSLNKSVNVLAEEIKFLHALTEKSLLIAIKQAYLLERIANRVYGLEDAEPINNLEVEKGFKEIRQLFDDQRAIMTGGGDG